MLFNIQMCVYLSKVPKSEHYTAICESTEYVESNAEYMGALWKLQLNNLVLTLLYAVIFSVRPLEFAAALCEFFFV